MNNERFAVPELLFHPSDVGIQEMGIAEAVVHVLSKLDEGLSVSLSALSVHLSVCTGTSVCLSLCQYIHISSFCQLPRLLSCTSASSTKS